MIYHIVGSFSFFFVKNKFSIQNHKIGGTKNCDVVNVRKKSEGVFSKNILKKNSEEKKLLTKVLVGTFN